MARGVLTDEVKKISKELLGYEIELGELRLLPYLMWRWMDNEPLKREQITERDIIALKKWEKKKLVFVEVSNFGKMVLFTSKFYDAVVQILKIGYCSDMEYKDKTR